MAKQGVQFEKEVLLSLKSIPSCYSYKIPDALPININGSYIINKRPFDFFACYHGQSIAIECKQTKVLTRFDIDLVKPHQIEALNDHSLAGGRSYILLNFRTSSVNRSFIISIEVFKGLMEGKKSIKFEYLDNNIPELRRFKNSNGVYIWDLENNLI